MTDQETIAVYNARVGDYESFVRRTKPDVTLLAFIARIIPGGRVLDLGCGPAASSAVMRDHGLQVDPVDASAEMVQLANSTYGIGARLASFHDIGEEDAYDGIWANFSLLHARPEDFPVHLRALHRAVVPGGAFHIGMKIGQGTKRDSLGRFYTYYSQDELSAHLTHAGFFVDDFVLGEGPGLVGVVEPWITMTATA